MFLSRAEKKYLYQQISKTLLKDIEQIRKNYAKARSCLIETYQNKTWADWLRQKAQEGNKQALTALRYSNRKNRNHYTLSGVGDDSSFVDVGQIDSITKEGTEIYSMGNSVIRDNGNEIKVCKGGSIATLKRALEIAQQRYGNCLQVNGSPLFKKVILQIVIQHHIPITFADLDMENQRQKMISIQRKQHEQFRSNRNNHRKRTSRGHGIARANTRNGRGGTKPNAFSIKRSAPSESQNSLRNLSQLDVVQFTGRGEVLLPDHAHDQLERQRLQFDNDVRRSVFNLRSNQKK